jgi:hypothetical protein
MLPVVFVSDFLRLEAKSPKVAGGAIFGTQGYPEQRISSR